jgi:hypothetical protein
VPHYFPTCGGVACSATQLTTVLANLAPVGTSWRVLCPYRSGFEGGGIELLVWLPPVCWLEGAVDGRPHEAQ